MANASDVNSRETWLNILEAASQQPGDQLNDQWEWLLQQLRMSADEYSALMEALRQGRWREAKNPKVYIKTVARREAYKEKAALQKNDRLVLMPVTRADDAPSAEVLLDRVSYLRDTSEAVRGGDGVWRRGGGAERDDDYYDENMPPRSLRGRLLAKMPKSLMLTVEPSSDYKRAVDEFNASTNDWHIHVEPLVEIDLSRWAEMAGFDKNEMRVLDYQATGISREKALAKQLDETSRKALQAAWKRFDRNGKQRLRDAAAKSLQQDVPERAHSHTR